MLDISTQEIKSKFIVNNIIIRNLGLSNYHECVENMKEFTSLRTPETKDEIWLTYHHAIYTLGQAGKKEHLIKKTNIPVVRTDRGGQITYHGPGQIIAYTMVNLNNKDYGVRTLVAKLETATIKLLHSYNLNAKRKNKMPGVYINDVKIAALGLKVKKSCSYHGISLNINNDLTPYDNINPCGYENLQVTSLANEGIEVNHATLIKQWINELTQEINKS